MNTQEHLLTKLTEECCEVAQDTTKAVCFGLDDKYGERPTNRQRIIAELNDLFAVVDMLVDAGMLPADWMDMKAQLAKKAKVVKYMVYAQKVGALDHGPLPQMPEYTNWDAASTIRGEINS